MGIKPEGDNPIIVPPDNIQSRWGAWEADLDAAGQEAGEVHLETWSLANSANEWVSQNSAKFQGLVEDSAGLGDESKTIQQQMRELIDPENPDSELFYALAEVDRLQTERADLLEEMAKTNREDIDRQAQYTSRMLFVPALTGAVDDYFVVSPASNGRWSVRADGGWTGYYTLQSAYLRNGNWEPVLDYRKVPNDDPESPRTQFHNGQEYSTIINYWVRNAIHRVDDEATGSFTSGNWVTSESLEFTAPVTADYSIFYRVTWGAATYDDNYSFRVQRNGSTIMQWGPKTHVGPQLPWKSGVRKRAISEARVPLAEGDALTFQTYSNADLASQRSVLESERKISWMMPATQENMAEQTWTMPPVGDGSFPRPEGMTGDISPEGDIEWNWQNSIRFLLNEVTASEPVAVHSYDTGVYSPVEAGTVIPRAAWIRTVEPHPASVTFTKKV